MINRIIRKLKKKKATADRQRFLEYYETEKVNPRAVFLEARNGKEIDGNIYYMLKELLLCPDYADYEISVASEEAVRDKIAAKIGRICPEAAERVSIKTVDSPEYYREITRAGFIICDATLKNFFIKKPGQVYLNVWHGTPFKVMGRRVIHEPHATGNAQKNFTIADYLLYPNEYMMEHMIEDYMIADTAEGKILLGGYPRNTAFFDGERGMEIREENGLTEKRVYVYMPTHRPSLMGETLRGVLDSMEQLLGDDEILYAKVHPLASDSIDYSCYSKIRKFPDEYETYEFLNMSDCLITDYSSVFYDFAVTGKKIVLYTYDEEEYLSTRGLYEPISSLPFTQVKTVEETLEAARTPKDYGDEAFIEKYCSHESPEAAKVLCRRVIKGDASGAAAGRLIEKDMPGNGRKNALVYVKDLRPGEKRDELMDFLENVDKKEYNWFLTFNRADVAEDKDVLLKLPEDVYYFGRAGKAYETGDARKNEELEKLRCFGNMRIDEAFYAE